jgi:hypothetical protein
MKKEKKIIGVRKAKKGEDGKALGTITFGKSRRDKIKYVLVDVEYDDKAGDELYKCGMLALKYDREAVIEYVIKKALKEYANLGRKNK